MKKYIQLLVVLSLVFTVVGLASNRSGWAGNTADPIEKASSIGLQDSAEFSPEPSSITITESGIYNVGGICTLDISYELLEGLRDEVDVNVPTEFSTNIPFGYEGALYLPGCHIMHYKNDEMMEEMSADDGSWEVCFAERPDMDLTVYYYQEEPFTTSPIWIELETTHKDGFACASAIYTGEYAPGSDVDDPVFEPSETTTVYYPGYQVGSVVVPPSSVTFTEPGTYSAGGICSLKVLYYKPYQTNEIHVADALRYDFDPVAGYDYSAYDYFPEDEGLLYMPGCHVLHYQSGEVTHWEKYVDQGDWEICFAAQPDKEMTIYVYLGDLENQEAAWVPLETTVEDGEACAPAFFTGVYVPTGK